MRMKPEARMIAIGLLPRQAALLILGTLVVGAAAHGDAGASCSDPEAAAAGLDLDVCWTPNRCFAPQIYPCTFMQTGAALLRTGCCELVFTDCSFCCC